MHCVYCCDLHVFGVVLVVIFGQKSTNAPYFAPKNRKKWRISAFFGNSGGAFCAFAVFLSGVVGQFAV